MKRVLSLCLSVLLSLMAAAQTAEDSIRPARPWRAAAEVVGINALVHS